MREEEDKVRLAGGDVEMKDESEESKVNKKINKQEEREKEEKLQDENLYREHGLGLDTGNYQLVAVVTHKGRSADGGHYVGWVHHKGNMWHEYDDDIVTSVKTEDIMNLKGGGDWHTAYLCIYRKIEVTRKQA